MKGMVRRFIITAKEKYPVGMTVKCVLNEKDIADLEKYCEVRVASVYMNGECAYHIRYKKELEE